MPFPDLKTMTREEIQQMVYETQVKQIEADLLVEQWRSQREERDDQARLFRIVSENMLDMAALTDMEGNFTFAGKSHEILGYEPGFLIGKNACPIRTVWTGSTRFSSGLWPGIGHLLTISKTVLFAGTERSA